MKGSGFYSIWSKPLRDGVSAKPPLAPTGFCVHRNFIIKASVAVNHRNGSFKWCETELNTRDLKKTHSNQPTSTRIIISRNEVNHTKTELRKPTELPISVPQRQDGSPKQ